MNDQTTSMKTKRLQLLAPRDGNDLQRYEKFLYDNPNKLLPIPRRKDIEHSASAGGIYILQDEQETIVAGAGLFLEYHHEETTAGRTLETIVYEFGGSRVTRPAGGTRPLKVQEILYALRILRFIVEQGVPMDGGSHEARACFLAAVREDNPDSISGTLNSGFQEVQTVPRWLRDYED